MKKTMSVLALAGLAVVAQQADASILVSGIVEGHVTSLSVSDKALENGLPDSDIEVTFDVAGTACGTNIPAGTVYRITRSQQTPDTFDNFLKTAQAAFLSGKTLRYGTGRTQNGGPCYAYYMQIK